MQTFSEGVDHALLKARGTGYSTSYVSTVAVGGTTFAQPAVHGEIHSDQGYFHITYAGATGITVSTLSAASTYVYIDNAGSLQQQITTPTRQDWSRKMFTMRISVDTVAESILGFEYLNNPIGHYANSIRDLYEYLIAQGVPFRKDQVVTGRSDLGFDVSAGTLMEFGGTGDIHNANIRNFDAVSNATYSLLSRTAVIGDQTDLVKYWDNAGTITALGSTTVVGHRLYRFSNGTFAMQYGQGNYANIDLAKTGAVLEAYDLNPRLLNATFFGWWFIQSTATVTTGTPTLTAFSEYTLGVQGGATNGLSGAALKGNNGSDFLDAAAVRTNIGLGTGDSPTFAGLTATGAFTSPGIDDNASSTAITIDSNGNVLVGAANVAAGVAKTPLGLYVEKSSTSSNSVVTFADSDASPAGNYTLELSTPNDAFWGTKYEVVFTSSSGAYGSISSTGSAVAYNTSSDYRLKENITPIQGAADIVKMMRPCTYTFKSDGSWADGFIAHEMQELHPQAVTGGKDAMQDEEYEVSPAVVDDDGKEISSAVMGTRSVPDYQGVDYSKLTPILTAALQEALAKIDVLETRLSALEG
jgi:hypothetical protein